MSERRLENGAKARQCSSVACSFCGFDTGIIKDPNAFTSDRLREHNIKARDVDFVTKRTIIDNTEVKPDRKGVLDTEEKATYLKAIDDRKVKYTGIGDYGSDITIARRLKKDIIVILVVDPLARRCCYKLCSSTKKYKDLATTKWKGPVDDEEFFKKLVELEALSKPKVVKRKVAHSSKR